MQCRFHQIFVRVVDVFAFGFFFGNVIFKLFEGAEEGDKLVCDVFFNLSFVELLELLFGFCSCFWSCSRWFWSSITRGISGNPVFDGTPDSGNFFNVPTDFIDCFFGFDERPFELVIEFATLLNRSNCSFSQCKDRERVNGSPLPEAQEIAYSG